MVGGIASAIVTKLGTPIQNKELLFFCLKTVTTKAPTEDFFIYLLLTVKQTTIKQSSMKLISKVTEIYCIADDFCKGYELEMNKKALSLSNPSPNNPKTRNRKGRLSDAEMISILVLFHSNTFRNFKHFYLFYVCRELKEEFPNLLSYTRYEEPLNGCVRQNNAP